MDNVKLRDSARYNISAEQIGIIVQIINDQYEVSFGDELDPTTIIVSADELVIAAPAEEMLGKLMGFRPKEKQ